MVNESERFRFLDDLSILEIINLLTVGLASFNLKSQVPSNVHTHNQIINPTNLRSQKWLNEISDLTKNQKMMINVEKTKTMIFNFTEKYQFGTKLEIEGTPIEVIDSTQLLGTLITKDLRWDQNTAHIVRKANAKMELLRRVASFGASVDDLKNIYVLFIRSQLEQSAVVWHSSLTDMNKNDLERIQKSAFKIILGDKYRSYRKSLQELELDTLEQRRENLCLNFALKAIENEKTKHLFPLRNTENKMKTRNEEMFEVQKANTKRLKDSTIIYMQRLLNHHIQK